MLKWVTSLVEEIWVMDFTQFSTVEIDFTCFNRLLSILIVFYYRLINVVNCLKQDLTCPVCCFTHHVRNFSPEQWPSKPVSWFSQKSPLTLCKWGTGRRLVTAVYICKPYRSSSIAKAWPSTTTQRSNEPQLSANHVCVEQVPTCAGYCAPDPSEEDFDSASIRNRRATETKRKLSICEKQNGDQQLRRETLQRNISALYLVRDNI